MRDMGKAAVVLEFLGFFGFGGVSSCSSSAAFFSGESLGMGGPDTVAIV